jgi:hypothetical protein
LPRLDGKCLAAQPAQTAAQQQSDQQRECPNWWNCARDRVIERQPVLRSVTPLIRDLNTGIRRNQRVRPGTL